MFSSPDKIETIDFQRTSLVIIDDFVGKYGFQRKKVLKWFLRFDQLYLAVAAGKLNIIVTCETSQLDKCNKEIKSHPLISYPLVLNKLPEYVKYIKQESTEGPVRRDSLFQIIPGAESVSVNALENIRYATTVCQNVLTTTPKVCCMLPYSEILLLDISNHLIKADSTYKEVGLCFLNAYFNVTGVCYICNNTVVVCANKELIYLDISRMLVKKTVKTNENCRSIAFNKEKAYLLRDDGVYTYTVEGRRLSHLYVSRDDDLRSLPFMFEGFQNPTLENIAVSDDGSKIYITTSDYKLITINSLGNHLNTLSLIVPTCVCVAERENVLVGSLCGEVYQDGAQIRNIISAVTGHLQTICYDRNTSSLITLSGSIISTLKLNY